MIRAPAGVQLNGGFNYMAYKNKEREKEYQKEYYQKNKEKIKEYRKKWHQENKEKIKKQKKKYREENLEKEKERHKKWRQFNLEKLREYKKEWQRKNPEYHKEYKKNRRQTNPKFKLDDNMANAIYLTLKGKKAGRAWETLTGYTIDDLMTHLEKQFEPWMNWNNYGKWHIDHRKPKSLFNYETAEDPEFKKCWSLENLQPLEAIKNLKKGNKY